MSVRSLTLHHGEDTYDLRLEGPDREGTVTLGTARRGDPGGDSLRLPELRARVTRRSGEVQLVCDDQVLRCVVAREGRGVWVAHRGRIAYLAPGGGAPRHALGPAATDEVRAPMTGLVVELRTTAGKRVLREEVLAVLEAMKMEYRLLAPRDGEVEEVSVNAGDRVELGTVVVRLARASQDPAAATR